MDLPYEVNVSLQNSKTLMTGADSYRSEGRSVLVEFLGAAGVGKSFLLSHTLRILKDRGLVARDFTSLEVNRFSPSSIFVTACASYSALKTRPHSFSAYIRTSRTIASYAARRRLVVSHGGLILCDEGLFHRIRRFHRQSKGLPMVLIADQVFRCTLPPDVVVVVEASPETIYGRRVARNRPGDIYSRDSVNADVLLVEESLATIEHVRERILPRLKIIRANAELPDVERVAESVASSLETLLRTGASSTSESA